MPVVQNQETRLWKYIVDIIKYLPELISWYKLPLVLDTYVLHQWIGPLTRWVSDMTCDQLLHLYFTRETSRHFSTPPASSECQPSPFLNSWIVLLCHCIAAVLQLRKLFSIFFLGLLLNYAWQALQNVKEDYKMTIITKSLKLTRSP